MRTALLPQRLAVIVSTLLLSSPAAATLLTVRDAASGESLSNAVIEVHVSGAPGRPGVQDDIIQRDAAFHPHVSAVPVDSRIRFPNQDSTRHHVYSFSPAKVFDLNLFLRDTPPPITFDQTGVVVLGCNIHDHMQAFIVVSDATHVGVTEEDGRWQIPDLPAGEHRVRIWHPRLDDSHQQWHDVSLDEQPQQEVLLTLTASAPPPAEPSALQQRFRDATQ
ncbi:carboxypeptidase regulatory-like domain-containing protein [Franzmannia qiaohouensis]|uniref:Carboxypeptidase regulatory-like domain-containing protein n=1 Tax=Franzmannia qiaohouensis TaxID=1329370 RepID=A0ABU1HIQ1_9GAMM|nr:carboxypeptidase regulatory-like domain-containing protein [Halomonas qiaohouensis]MDR5906659.1 carboxypeptidase regulatory-like domain-containing protein [Halomonas qiaohouensis]